MNQLLILFIAMPMVSFFASLLWQNKSEKAIGNIVRVAKLSNLFIAFLFFAWWLYNGQEAVSYKAVTLYETDDFVFALQLYYDEISAVFSIVGALLFFLVATCSKYYMPRKEV